MLKHCIRIAIFVILVTAMQPLSAQEQSPGSSTSPGHVDASLFAGPEQPVVFGDLKIRTTDLLEASLSVENKGGSLTYAPLLYGLATYQPWLSELRLRLGQKDNLTTLGIGSQYNPLSPRGKRGAQLWTASLSAVANALSVPLTRQAAEIEEKLKAQRADYAAIRLPAAATEKELLELKAKQQAITAEVLALEVAVMPMRAELAALDAADKEITDNRIRDFYRDLLKTRMPVLGAAYNVTLFQVISGSSQDADNDGLNDLEHRVRKHSLSLSADSRLGERFQLSLLVSKEWERNAAEMGTGVAELEGAAITAGGIVAVLDSDYRSSKAYLESLFIPSIVLGGSLEYRRCRNASTPGVGCPDKLQRLTSLTPFIDMKISKTAQFRIGAPFKWSKPVNGAGGVELGVVTALTVQMGEPK